MLSDEKKKLAIELAQQGKSIRKIREDIEIEINAFYAALREDLVFAEGFSCARHEGLEELADELIEIPDEYADPQRGRLKSDNIKFLLSKRKPQVYGDRLDLNVSNNVDISGALAEAKARALPMRDLKILDVPHVVKKIEEVIANATGHKPDAATDDETPMIEEVDIFS